MKTASSAQSPVGIDQRQRFIKLSHQLVALGEREDLKIIPHHDSALPHFSGLTPAGRAHALWMLEIMVMIGERLQRQGTVITKSRALVWAFFSHMKLRPPADFQEMISDDNEAINIYNDAHQMMFANLGFFRITSHSIEDLYCRPWTEIFTNDNAELAAYFYKVCSGFISGEIRESVKMTHTPPYMCQEINTPLMISTLISTKILSPLTNPHGSVAGYVGIHGYKVLSCAGRSILQ